MGIDSPLVLKVLYGIRTLVTMSIAFPIAIVLCNRRLEHALATTDKFKKITLKNRLVMYLQYPNIAAFLYHEVMMSPQSEIGI